MIVKASPEGIVASVQAATLAGTQAATGGSRKRAPPPVHLWNPPFCGDIDMRIARDGTWFHEGTPIGRAGLVNLFSSILRREGDKYFLVTPVEKVGIIVEDAPMVAQDFSATGEGPGQTLCFHTKTEDEVICDAAHPLRITRNPDTGEPSPYILIRANLEALIDRKSFYRLIELGCHETVDGQGWFGIWSGGTFFPIILTADLT